jgi:oxygen-independent coproporphyrinogen-3 oxidase
VGAARYVGGVREVNTREIHAYLARIESGEPATGPTETLDPEARARETAVLMLRRTRLGIDRDDFRRRTGFDLDRLAGPALRKHLGLGLLEDDSRTVRFTREGLFLADSVLCDLL